MSDRSPEDEGCEVQFRDPWKEEKATPDASAPPPLNQEDESRRDVHSHPIPHQDPHQLQLQQGELRHRSDEARGSPPGQQRHHGQSAQPNTQHQQPSLFQAALAATAQTQSHHHPETQPTSSSTTGAHPTYTQVPSDPLPPSLSSAGTASLDPLSSASSTTSEGTPAPRIIDRDRIRSLASGEPSPASSGVATPTITHPQHPHKSIRPFVKAVMAFEKARKFSTGTSVHRKRQMSTLVEREGHFGPALTVCHSP